jgi:hypothetical protein
LQSLQGNGQARDVQMFCMRWEAFFAVPELWRWRTGFWQGGRAIGGGGGGFFEGGGHCVGGVLVVWWFGAARCFQVYRMQWAGISGAHGRRCVRFWSCLRRLPRFWDGFAGVCAVQGDGDARSVQVFLV